MGENFDEQMATTFVAQFREAGLRVKIVGLRHKQTSGTYGVALVPDMTLSQALPLASQVRCVVLPCHLPYLTHLENDPRIEDFFQDAGRNDAQFVTGRVELSELGQFVKPMNVISYMTNYDVTESFNLLLCRLTVPTDM